MMSHGMLTNKRDLRFDSLRGLMLVCMTVNHLPSRLRFFTDESIGLFSAAEGFVFLSGLMAGWIYAQRLRKEGPDALMDMCRRRATMIYRWQVAAFLACFAVVRLTCILFGFCSQNAPQLFYQNPVLAMLLGTTMLHQPGLLDILPMYCALVVALPYALRALDAGRHLWVIGISFALWLVAQWAPPMDTISFYPINIGSFNLFAWQFLFFLGVIAGHARLNPASPVIRPRLLLMAGALGVAVFCFGVQHLGWRPPWTDAHFGTSINKPALGALRLASFAVAAYFVALAGARFPRLLTWPPLAFLGRHSLAVVAAQSVTAMFLVQFPALFATPASDLAMTAAAVGYLFLAAAVHEAWQRREARISGFGRTRRSPRAAATLNPAA
jgi:hypothetical protein